MKSRQLTTTSETHRLMAEVFAANEPAESVVALRMVGAREKRRASRGESRIRRRFAWGAAAAMLCLCGTALGVAVQAGVVQIGPIWVKSAPAPALKDAAPQQGRAAQPPASRQVAPTSGLDGEASPDSDSDSEDSSSASPVQSARDVRKEKAAVPGQDEPAPVERDEANWRKVADAMRKGSDERAKEAILPLKESEDPETRDAAELVQLRIELGSQQTGTLHATGAQRARLERLAQEGASPSIRASARRLKDRLAPVGVRDFREMER